MGRIIPKPDEGEALIASNVQLPKSLWADLDLIEAHENHLANEAVKGTKAKPVKSSRTKVMRHFLVWARNEYWKDEGAPDPEKDQASFTLFMSRLRAEYLKSGLLEEPKKQGAGQR